ncbi:endogenous retrovirus group K member 25 Pro protein-like protein [Turdus rufiventris]|nr:endogenous retrovirus group K member 25 Pro protein-like protein [Turdus rufiventris]
MTLYYMELDNEYFDIGNTAHTPLEIEVAPMTIKESITCLILLVRCPQPFYLVEEQILPQAIPIPTEVTVAGKSPEVYWAEVVDEDKPSLACNLTHGSHPLHVEGVLDTGADVMIIPKRMWLSHWELQLMSGKIQGVGGVKLAKISKSVVQIEGSDGKLASVYPFVTDYKCPLWGRDTISQGESK